MNLQECKDRVAQRMGFSNWKRFEQFVKPTSAIVDEVATIYAIEKVKEALKLSANRAEVVYHDGTTKKETNHGRVNIGNNHIRPDLALILSLETEIIEDIKNEK